MVTNSCVLAAMDSDNIPVIVPKVVPHTDAGIELFDGGYERRVRRLERRHELVELLNNTV